MMIAVQVLDSITGAAVTVLTILVLTDLTTGTGGFNLAQGILGTLMGIAVALGTSAIGFTVERYGDVTGFVVMAAGTSVAMVLLWALLPETKPEKYLD